MKSILFATVQHTGTQFFERLLCPLFDNNDASMIVDHLCPDRLDKIKSYVPGRVLVTTIRDWDSVGKSFEKRGDAWCPQEEQIRCWLEFLTFNPIIVSVDCQREQRLSHLSKVLGVELKTDWKPVNGYT